MYEFTLLKSMFFELDKYKIEGVTQTQEGQRTFHRLEVSYDSVPEVTSITAEERILPYVDRYYLFINDERVETDIRDPKVKQVIYEFYKQYHPEYLKEDLPNDMTDVDILECFYVFKMQDYRKLDTRTTKKGEKKWITRTQVQILKLATNQQS